jgi:hypothetical protein
MIYRIKGSKSYASKETIRGSVLSDIFTFLMAVALLYISKTFFDNSCLALIIMFCSLTGIVSRYNIREVTKDELIEIIKQEKSNENSF